MKIWTTTYWTTEFEPVVTPFDNQEAAETCARYYKRQGYKVCIDECDIFHNCMVTKELEQESKTKWIPVSNPQKELPKDRTLWVTIDDDRYAQDKGGYYWQGGLAVTTIYWDMTEWSDDIVDYVLAYMDYVEPMPYQPESVDKE